MPRRKASDDGESPKGAVRKDAEDKREGPWFGGDARGAERDKWDPERSFRASTREEKVGHHRRDKLPDACIDISPDKCISVFRSCMISAISLSSHNISRIRSLNPTLYTCNVSVSTCVQAIADGFGYTS